MRSNKVIVVASDSERPYANALSARLNDYGFDAWSVDQVLVGKSLVEEIDRSIRLSCALVIIHSADLSHDNWGAIQTYAFQSRLRYDNELKILVVPRGVYVVSPTLDAQAIVLTRDLDALQAADRCAAAIKGGEGLSSFQPRRPPDNRNSPLLNPDAWSEVRRYENTYSRYVRAASDLLDLGEYEHASDIYWKTLYFSGFRERWRQRSALSKKLAAIGSKSKDHLNTGLVLAKGIAYIHMTLKDYPRAKRLLRRAFGEFRKARDTRGQGICWQYLGDIYVEEDKPNRVFEAYNEAVNRMRGIERRQIQLHKQMYLAILETVATPRRVDEFINIRDELALLHDYREGLASMQISRDLYTLGARGEALVEARRAEHLLSDVIKMPRFAKRARRLANRMERGLPIRD